MNSIILSKAGDATAAPPPASSRPVAPRQGPSAPRLPVWEERARKMGFPPTPR